MFTKKESLYINAIKSDAQLKLDYKRLSNEQVVSMANSVFPVDNHMLPSEIAQKLNASQAQIDNTYISTLLISDTTKLVPKGLADKLTDCEVANFNNELDIVVLKTTLFETQDYFSKTGIDYIYSLFHVMNLHIEKTVCKNELLMFVYNEKAFILILDKAGMIAHNEVIDLPTFDSIKKTHFYDDELDGQKLFDEIFYLEFSEIIQNILATFYEKKSNTFVENVTILYVLKQFSPEQITQLEEDLLLKVNYHPINIDEEIFELSKDKHLQKSFIKPRKKQKKTNFTNLYIFLFILSIFALAYIVYLNVDFKVFTDKLSKKETYIEKAQNIKKIDNVSELPDHVNLNDKIYKSLKSIFESVSNDVVINELKIDKNILELKGNFLKEDTFSTSLRPSLIKLYKDVILSTSSDKKIDIPGVVIAREDIEQKVSYKTYGKNYLVDEFMPLESVLEQLKILLPVGSTIKLNTTTSSSNITRFMYTVNFIAKDPKEFFDLIESLNDELYSIHVSYPLSMIKTKDGIETEFILIFNQPNEVK